MHVSSPGMKHVILVLVILFYWLLGYLPFHPLPEFNNGVVYQAGSELKFPVSGIAYTRSAPDWLDKAITSSSIDILLDVQTFAIDQTGPARIFTISGNTGFRNIMIGQQEDVLVIRLRRSAETFNGVPPFVMPKVFTDLKRHKIHVSIIPGELTISVDDTDKLTEKIPADTFATWIPDFRLALGNEITFDRPWMGIIRQALVNIDGRQYDYLAPAVLAVPDTYYPHTQPDKTHRIPFYPESYSLSLVLDWLVNFFGFIPLGLLIVILYPGRVGVGQVAIICLGVSIVIESMQLLLPWRHPAVEDLILNMLGGATGALVGMNYSKDKHIKQQADS